MKLGVFIASDTHDVVNVLPRYEESFLEQSVYSPPQMEWVRPTNSLVSHTGHSAE